MGESPKGPFGAYPTDRVIAILATPRAANTARANLIAAGIAAGTIHTACGDEGLYELELSAERHGLAGRAGRGVQEVIELAEYKERFEQALRGGECLLAVVAAEGETRALVHQRLKACGARYINFFARLGVQRLEP